jgi:hypothetical protein
MLYPVPGKLAGFEETAHTLAKGLHRLCDPLQKIFNQNVSDKEPEFSFFVGSACDWYLFVSVYHTYVCFRIRAGFLQP